MDWLVRIGRSARKNLARFPKRDYHRLMEVLKDFRLGPYTGDIEKIDGEDTAWRRRVGNYRILYDVDVKNKTVEVVDIRRRTSSTY